MADFLSGYDEGVRQRRENDMGQLQQASVLQGILSKVRAEKQAQVDQQRMQDFQTKMAAADTVEKKIAVATEYGAPKEVLTTLQGSLDRQATRDNTKQIAMTRLSQQFQRDTADIAHKARTATTQEEKFHWQQQMDTLKASATKQAADIAAGRYTYDTGGVVAPFQGTVPQAGVAAPTPQGAFPAAAPTPEERAAMAQLRPLAQGGGSVEVVPGGAMSPVPPQGALAQIASAAQQQAPVQLAAQNSLDARDLGAGARGPVMGAPVAAPIASPTPAAQPASPQMPNFTGSPREVNRAKNDWLQDQAKAKLVAAGKLNIAGGRESVFINRVVNSGNQAAADLENVIKLPMSASRGLFGGRAQGKSLFEAGKETLANTMTTQEVQTYNVFATGFQRALAAIEGAGLAPSNALMHQMDAVIFKEGDTQFTKLAKLAQTRQIVEKGMESILVNSRVDEGTKKLVESIVSKVKTAVPFTGAELLQLEIAQQSDPNATLQDIMKQTKAGSSGGWSIRPR